MQKQVSGRASLSRVSSSQGVKQQRRRRFLAGESRAAFKTSKLSVETLEARHLMAGAYFAPPEPTGSVNVQLTPLANVAAGTQEIVTFGVPFTRGSISAAQLSNVRVLKNGVEIPAYVEQLTPWRSIDDPAIDGQSVRVARIQIPYTFSALSTESITVEWGGTARTLNRTTLQDPRIEWHTVTSGTFVAGDNVEEPDVLPVLPKEYLAKGMLDARTDPTANAVAPTRDDPAVTDAMNFSGYTELDYAQKNFFYTIINQNPGITVNYKTDPEPWLYDRASGMYELYLRSGFTTALREAVRAADFYADHINSQGFFTLKAGDAKYAYNESLAYTYWLMGDSKMLTPISNVVSAHSGTVTRWNPNLSFWTERNVGYKLLANEVGYEVTGNAAFKNTVQTIVADLIWHQNGAGGQLPTNRVDGGLYHIGEQHDASEVEDPNVLIASSWMSALIVDPMVRVYGVWQNAQVSDFIVRMGNFEKVASKVDGDGQFEAGSMRYPDYLMRTDGTSENRTDTDVQHALDVGAVAAWATYFADLRGTPDASLRQLANDLYHTYDIGVNYWTRPGGTNFNVSPPRRYTWEYKNAASFSWALTSSDSAGQPGSLQFSASNFTVNEAQGTATITVSRSGGSTGAVSVNYATSNGTATAGSDYTATSGVLNFGAGEITKTFVIPIINDTAVEVAETVTLTLSNPTGGASLASPSTATLTIESDDTTNQPTTTTVQQGVSGYTGTTDVSITNQYAQFTGGNGSTSVTDPQGGVYQISGTNGYSIETLIRFANLGIPTNANVSAATLTLSVDTFSNNPTIRGYYLAAPWSVDPGTDLGWVHRGTGQNWNTPGALGQGTDVLAGKSFVLSGIQGTGTQAVTINLDPAVVQGWINNPSSNNGILLVNETTGAVVRINMSEQTNAALRPKLGVTYTVGTQSPQPGSLQLSAAAYAVNENQGTATITVTRSGGSEGAVAVNYATSNGTATAGSDYTATSGVLNFAAGEVSKTFTIPIINDTAVEGLETVNITLSNPTGGATLGSQVTSTLTITSDDFAAQPGSLQFNSATYAVNEANGTATITVTRTGGSDGAVSIAYATSNGSATAGSDYTATSGTLNFAAGETSKSFTIPIINDTAVEGLETVNLTLSNPTGGATLGGQATATLTITSDDVATVPGVLQFSSATYAVNETNGTATITVTRTVGSDGAVSVAYATSNGTATAGSDYAATSGVLSFAAGELSKTFTVSIINDTAVESPETVTLTLSNPTGGATLGSQATSTLTITSDDVATVPGALQFSSATYSVSETNGTVTITVTRTGGSDGAVSVAYATSNGTAAAGSDYTATSGVLNFAAGEISKSFTIPIINDTAIESPETITLTLSNPTGGATLGGVATATLTIISDDTNGQPVTVSLQQGVNGYTGTTDVSISTQYAQYNSGNGLTTFNDPQMGLYQIPGNGAYSVEDLIRFSNLGIPADAAVTGATLTLRVDSWDANPTIRGYYVAAPWSATPGASSTQLGWLSRGNGQSWSAPGARGQGTDVIAGKSFTLPTIRAVGGQTITVALDPAVVQSWVNNPAANQGILLVNESTGLVVRISTSEAATVSQRPKLSVTYSAATPAAQPLSTPLVQGASSNVSNLAAGASTSLKSAGIQASAVDVALLELLNAQTRNKSGASSDDLNAATSQSRTTKALCELFAESDQ
ncbi:Calx-beta domain-containing protein [Anatilimnocola floriformis]|uniref:Calx-beta domain-containing protein n=1 Tax=Anatilimnocola floriformis TaxID=2948575 RepID=UPI0020C4F74D|nr:Calx-beta domain-containing protein [Anatilimnocola floriformis]